ncbi:hypothetical protein [Mycobacterium saskatchewanense]|uniref:Uncharacterized protein n=1 Tax=Mycobacterium saskatchewanense TaxID=220927 RepID=A0AAJ3NM58_9MYCO|nr:hypothetical protein AWC23_21595 [Mycobacterium saskatchewanense]
MALASDGPVDIADGVSISPAPGWAVGHRGPNWVAISKTDGSAQLRVAVKPADGADIAAILQNDIDHYAASTGLTNLHNVDAPTPGPAQSADFQQQISVDYTADVSAPQGPIPVLGAFTELLNPSNHLSAFIDFRQNNNATPQAVEDGGMMIRSL